MHSRAGLHLLFEARLLFEDVQYVVQWRLLVGRGWNWHADRRSRTALFTVQATSSADPVIPAMPRSAGGRRIAFRRRPSGRFRSTRSTWTGRGKGRTWTVPGHVCTVTDVLLPRGRADMRAGFDECLESLVAAMLRFSLDRSVSCLRPCDKIHAWNSSRLEAPA